MLLLNQIAHETPIINSSTRLSSNPEIKCWTMFKALYTPSPFLTWFASLCSITNPNFSNSWVKVLTNTSQILPCNRIHHSCTDLQEPSPYIRVPRKPLYPSIRWNHLQFRWRHPQSRDHLLLLEEYPALSTPQCQSGTEQQQIHHGITAVGKYRRRLLI